MSEDSLEMWLREAPIAAIAGSLEFDEGTGLLLSTDRRSSQFRLGSLRSFPIPAISSWLYESSVHIEYDKFYTTESFFLTIQVSDLQALRKRHI